MPTSNRLNDYKCYNVSKKLKLQIEKNGPSSFFPWPLRMFNVITTKISVRVIIGFFNLKTNVVQGYLQVLVKLEANLTNVQPLTTD